VDEKPQIQALERTAATLPVRPGHPQAASFDYVRHGTTTLFAALEVATGKVTEACTERHRHQEFLAFLNQVAAAYPRRELHVVVDNLSTHKHPAVRAWLARHPRVQLHFTPTSGSWLNLVEAFFSIITRQALRRGNHPTVADLVAAIERFIHAWNDRCRPFTWTKDPRHRHRQGHRPAPPQDTNDVRYGALGRVSPILTGGSGRSGLCSIATI
jgi:transposase